jgi:hypothetical protein
MPIDEGSWDAVAGEAQKCNTASLAPLLTSYKSLGMFFTSLGFSLFPIKP